MNEKYAFYTTTTSSLLDGSSISSGSIETYHLSASSVTPTKVDLTQGWDFSSGTLSVANPSAPAEAAPRSYVLSSISESLGGGGISNAAKGAVKTVLIADDEIVSYFSYNAASGTLTVGENENINNFNINGITDFVVNDRLLFAVPQSAACFSASGSWSGIYTITTVGIPDPMGTPPVLTRADDFNSIEDVISGSFVFVTTPSSSLDIWYLKTSGSITFEATPLLFASASFGGGSYSGTSPIQVVGTVISLESGKITPSHLSSSIAGSGLSLSPIAGLSVIPDPITDIYNPLLVGAGGVRVRPANSSQSGYVGSTQFAQIENVISRSAIPATAGLIATPSTTSNTETVGFYIGGVPENTIWTVKFNTFSFDTANPVNQYSAIGACAFYRSGSEDVTQVGDIEIQHTFASGAFTYVTMSANAIPGVSGSVDFIMQGISTYNIKHWAKFQITEFTYA